MRIQQQIWNKEHTDQKTLQGMQPIEPSSFVVKFATYLKENVLLERSVIDIGCGKGRNAIYMAKLGYDVTAVDYSTVALQFAKEQAKQQKATVNFMNVDISRPWPFKDNSFDIAIDCFSSIDVETKKGRLTYRDEMLRTVKPGGLVFIASVSANDELEHEMIKNNPGKEKK